MTTAPHTPSVRLPRSALSTLSHRCANLGETGVEALREAGYRAGSEVIAALGEVPADLPVEEFWSRLDTAFQHAGLGSVSFETVSPDVGAVAWSDSLEAMSDGGRSHCHFAQGLLGGVLSRAAGRTVDVVEVRCGGGGSRPCWFAFGSMETLDGVRERLAPSAASGEQGVPESPSTPEDTGA